MPNVQITVRFRWDIWLLSDPVTFPASISSFMKFSIKCRSFFYFGFFRLICHKYHTFPYIYVPLNILIILTYRNARFKKVICIILVFYEKPPIYTDISSVACISRFIFI